MNRLDMPEPRPWCALPPGGVVVLYPGASVQYEHCDFPPGTTFRFYYGYKGDFPMDTDQPTSPTTAPAPIPTTEQQPPAPPAFDPAQLQQLGADNPMLAIALAGIAVLGGSAAWKHYAKTAEQKHERSMKELELRSQVPTTQPPPCQAADAATRAQLASLEARVAKAEQAQSSLSVGLSDEMEERIAKLERANKAKKAGK